MATADMTATDVSPGNGILVGCTECGDIWRVSPQPLRSWIVGEGDDAGLHYVEDDASPDRALTACGRSILENDDGTLLYLAETDAVALEQDEPGDFDWCEDCLNEAAELVAAGALPGIDFDSVPHRVGGPKERWQQPAHAPQ